MRLPGLVTARSYEFDSVRLIHQLSGNRRAQFPARFQVVLAPLAHHHHGPSGFHQLRSLTLVASSQRVFN